MSGYVYGELDSRVKPIEIVRNSAFLDTLKQIENICGDAVLGGQTYAEAIRVLVSKEYAEFFGGLYIAQLRILQAGWLDLASLKELDMSPKSIETMPRLPDVRNTKLLIAHRPEILKVEEMAEVVGFSKPDYKNGNHDWQLEVDQDNVRDAGTSQVPIQVKFDTGDQFGLTVVKDYKVVFKRT